MAAWPSNLPGPQRTISVRPGSNLTRQTWQSGRAEVRRFGAGTPDQVTVQFRLFNEDCAAFQYFCDRTANHGVNWFSAPWLAAMGYPSHRARILGYPKRKGRGVRYSDYSVTLLIQDAASAPEDTFWPSAGPGTGSGGETPAAGQVECTGHLSAAYPAPTDVQFVLVDCEALTGIWGGITDGGALRLWGVSVDSKYPGWAAIGGLIDIAFNCYCTYSSVTYGLYYLTSSGVIGHLGTPRAGTGYPTGAGYTKIWASGRVGLAQNADGLIEAWGGSAGSYFPSGVDIYRPVQVAFFEQTGLGGIVDENNVAHSLIPSATRSDSFDNVAGVERVLVPTGPNWGYSLYNTDGTWTDKNSYVMTTGRPAGLVPVFLEGHYSSTSKYVGLAQHQDGQFLWWGAGISTPPPTSGTKTFLTGYKQFRATTKFVSSGSTQLLTVSTIGILPPT
ncbi:hypothetical protein [Desulfuromonas thiophila]|uniref:hypothetical protein n=1 Tax=Desulfuromonas thiophila TaxID=57664 RepID=UPI0029F52E29|nr:hypothetical protein [Desulfuromonas thiophila]